MLVLQIRGVGVGVTGVAVGNEINFWPDIEHPVIITLSKIRSINNLK